jgi:hypothetical protein
MLLIFSRKRIVRKTEITEFAMQLVALPHDGDLQSATISRKEKASKKREIRLGSRASLASPRASR